MMVSGDYKHDDFVQTTTDHRHFALGESSLSSSLFDSLPMSSPIRALSSLVGLQLFARAFTFILNHALLRIASPESFGTASIQFELLLSTILFLSRQGIRNALLQCPPSRAKSPLVTNIALLPIFIGVPVAVLATGIYRYVSSQATRNQAHFDLGIIIYTLAAFSELLSEPLYIRAQNDLRLGVRVRAEGFAVVSKTVTTLAALVMFGPGWSLVAFALGQAAFGLTVLAVFLWEYPGEIQFLPKREFVFVWLLGVISRADATYIGIMHHILTVHCCACPLR